MTQTAIDLEATAKVIEWARTKTAQSHIMRSSFGNKLKAIGVTKESLSQSLKNGNEVIIKALGNEL